MIATEIEDPFGTDSNDLDAPAMQQLMNDRLLTLAHPLSLLPPGKSCGLAERLESTIANDLFEETKLSNLYDTISSDDRKSQTDILRAITKKATLAVMHRKPILEEECEQAVVPLPRSTTSSAITSNSRSMAARTLTSQELICGDRSEDLVSFDSGNQHGRNRTSSTPKRVHFRDDGEALRAAPMSKEAMGQHADDHEQTPGEEEWGDQVMSV